MDNDSHYLLERLDARFAKSMNISGYDLELSSSIQHDISSDPYISAANVYKDETRFQVGLSMSF